MSNLGDRLQDEIDAILGLQTAEEKGTEEGDEWDTEYEGYVTEVQNVFNDAAPDTIRNSNGEITADVNNASTDTTELSVTNVGFRAELSANQSVADRTITKVAFDTARYDDTGEFDTANSKFIADNAGTYAVTASIYWLGGDTGSKHTTFIYKNGSQHLKERGLGSYSRSVGGTVRLAAGDVLECYVRQQTGVSEDIADNYDWTYFIVSQVG